MYARIITEGMFGIRPTGLRSFTLTPHLPESWDHMNLRSVRAFEKEFDVEVKQSENGKNEVSVLVAGKPIFKQTVRNGKTIQIHLPK